MVNNLAVKCQDIDNSSLMVKSAKRSIHPGYRIILFSTWYGGSKRIILGENGPLKMLVGDQDDYFAVSMPRPYRQLVIKCTMIET
jgi:poly(3-hydroxyalkanoate) synthetase